MKRQFRISLNVFCIFLILSICLAFFVPTSAQSTPPNDGDWTIKDSEIITRESVTLNGNIIIKNGGELQLNYADLKFNSNKDFEYKIHVEDGGELEIRYSNINLNSDHSIVIIVEPDGDLDVFNSTMSEFTTIEPETTDSSSALRVAGISILVVIIIVIILFMLIGFLMFKRAKYVEDLKKMVDNTGVVEDTIIPGQFTGQVKIESEVKNAITKGSKNIESGEKVKVVAVENYHLVVEKIDK